MKIKARKICIICEGFEEVEYLDALINKAIFSLKYEFTLINSKSINNISKIYQMRFQTNFYDLVLIFCDTDKGPSDKYMEIKEEINKFHEQDIANQLVIFGNPCTMQIILSHFAEVKLKSQSKSVNSELIKKYVGIDNYKATDAQRKELFSKIKRNNYEIMKNNVSRLSTNDNEISSTNILEFLEKFENDDDKWIDDINNKI